MEDNPQYLEIEEVLDKNGNVECLIYKAKQPLLILDEESKNILNKIFNKNKTMFVK